MYLIPYEKILNFVDHSLALKYYFGAIILRAFLDIAYRRNQLLRAQ